MSDSINEVKIATNKTRGVIGITHYLLMFAAFSLPQDYPNVRGNVRANGVRGANRRCDCDGNRPDTLGGQH